MSMFDPVPYETTMEAKKTMDVAAGRIDDDHAEPVRGMKSMVAGAAIALESGGSDIGRKRATSAEEWLDPTRFDGAMLHRALGRVINQAHAAGSEIEMSSKGVISALVADVSLQSAASRETMLGEAIAISPREQEDRDHTARGRFDQISPSGRDKVIAGMADGRGVPQSVKAEVSAVASVVDRDLQGISQHGRNIISTLADFSEHAPDRKPLFRDMKTPKNEALYAEALSRAGELMLGRGAPPSGHAELAVAAHIRGVGDVGNGRIANDARARLLVEGAMEGSDVGRAARAIQGEVVAVSTASRAMVEHIGETRVASSVDKIAYGRFSSLNDQEQTWTFQAIQYAEGVSPLVGMRIERAADELQRETKDIEVQQDRKGVAVARMAASQDGRSL